MFKFKQFDDNRLIFDIEEKYPYTRDVVYRIDIDDLYYIAFSHSIDLENMTFTCENLNWNICTYIRENDDADIRLSILGEEYEDLNVYQIRSIHVRPENIFSPNCLNEMHTHYIISRDNRTPDMVEIDIPLDKHKEYWEYIDAMTPEKYRDLI